MHVISVRRNVAPDDKIAACCHIDIVSGLELPVSHVVFLYVHKGCVMVRFAEAVPISADMNIICVLFEHGEIEISNNQIENAIRPFVVGRKGWLFADTLQGAEASAIIYSLMETAKANSLRPDDDLLHLLSILPERAERNKDFEVDDLLPWSEEMKSWFSAVRVLGTTAFLYRGDY